jgi:calmodulin
MDKKLLQEFKDAFLMLDRDGDGRISSEELGFVMRTLGHKVSDWQLKQMMKMIDGDGKNNRV